jgi:hypothetical protein
MPLGEPSTSNAPCSVQWRLYASGGSSVNPVAEANSRKFRQLRDEPICDPHACRFSDDRSRQNDQGQTLDTSGMDGGECADSAPIDPPGTGPGSDPGRVRIGQSRCVDTAPIDPQGDHEEMHRAGGVFVRLSD